MIAERSTYKKNKAAYLDAAKKMKIKVSKSDIVIGFREYALSEGICYGFLVVIRKSTAIKYHKSYGILYKEVLTGKISRQKIAEIKKYTGIFEDIKFLTT